MAPTRPKRTEKALKKAQGDKEITKVADPLKEAISTLGGDDEDYALLRGVDDDHEMIASSSHVDVCF